MDIKYFCSILDNTHQLICRFLPDTTLTYVNKAYCEYFQKKREELIGKQFVVLIPEEEQKQVQNNILSVQGSIANSIEHKVILSNGEIRWHKWINIAIFDENDNVIEYQAVGEDITAQKEAEVKLKKTTRELVVSNLESFKILENNPIGINVLNEFGILVYANHAFCNLFGYDLKELLYKPFYQLFPKDENSFYSNLFLKFYKNDEKEFLIEKDILTKSDKSISVLMQGVKYFQSDKSIKVIMYVVDLTDIKIAKDNTEKALEHERHLNELKSRFIMFVSHEFRTPITVIKSSVQILEKYFDKIDNAKKLSLLEDINHASNYLVTLLDDAVFIDKVETGKLSIAYTPLNIKFFCEDIINEIKRQKTLPLDIITIYLLEYESFHTDPTLVKYILLNLLSNAIKYSNGKQTILKVRTYHNSICFTLADKGIGIPDKDKKFLFTAFHRAKNVKNIEGIGLGLVIVRQAVNLLKGKIMVRSKEKIGTVVRLLLPK